MISIKTADQIEKITRSAQILAEVKQIVFDAIRQGVSLKELDSIAFKEINARGAKSAFNGYQGFPANICASLNQELIHGIPDDRILENGDLISIDMGVIYQGFYSDSAFTKGVGQITKMDQKLIDVAQQSFYAGLNAIRPGARIGDIGAAIGEVIHKANLYTPKNYSGHGIGKKLHEEPYVFNEGQKNTGPLLRDGMVICIEPMILQDSNQVFTKKDKWTVVAVSGKNAAHYEHTVLIKDGYPIILTGGI